MTEPQTPDTGGVGARESRGTLSHLAERFFKVQPGEGRLVALMIAHSFFMGVSTAFFDNSSGSLFLDRFDAPLLGYVYLAAALVTGATGIVFSRLKEQVSFARLLFSTLLFLLVVGFAVSAGLRLTRAPWIVFSLPIWNRVLSILTDLQFWALAIRLFDVRQSKRLFGLIATGEIVARIVTNFSIKPLLKSHMLSVDDLILGSAVSLAMCLLFLVLTIRSHADRLTIPQQAPGVKMSGPSAGGRWTGLGGLLSDRYLSLILLLAVFAAFGKYFVEFAFQAQLKGHFEGATGISEFKATFDGWSQSVSLVTMMLSGRIIGRFGVRVGLVILPVLQIICTLAILAAGYAPEMPSTVFWLVILNQGLYKTLSKPIDSPSLKVLYKPLAPAVRLSAQIALEAIVTPMTIGAVGLIILVLGSKSVDPVGFSWVILVALAGWATAGVLAYRRYSRALMDALKKRTLGDGDFSLNDESSIAVIRQNLDSDWPGDVIYGLTLLESAEHGSLADSLAHALSHPSPDVRRYSLSRVEALAVSACRDSVMTILTCPSEPSGVRSAAARALCALGGEGIDDAIAPFLSDPDRQLRIGAMIGLLVRSDGTRRGDVRARLDQLAKSTDPAERAIAAQVIGEAPHVDLDTQLFDLIRDPDSSPRRASLLAAGRSSDRRVWLEVIANLTTHGFYDEAAQSIVLGGEAVVPDLSVAFDDPRRSADDRARIVRVVGRIPGHTSKKFLLNRLDMSDARVRHHIHVSLHRLGFRADGATASQIESAFLKEVGESARMLAAIDELSTDPECAILVKSLSAAVTRSRTSILLLLSFLHDSATIMRASEYLTHETREKRAYAVELIDIAIHSYQKAFVLPLIENLEPRQRIERLAGMFPQVQQGRDKWLGEIASWKRGAVSSWSRCCALYIIGHTRIRSLAGSVAAAATAEEERTVRDTATWTLSQFESNTSRDGNREGRHMLTIEKVIILKSVNIFAKLTEERLAEIASILTEVEFRPGEEIIRKGDVGDSMYIIIDGKVRIHDEGRTLATLGERDILGEIALLDHQPRSASANAGDEEVRALRLEHDAFYELMSDHIEVVTGVLQVLCERLRKLMILTSAKS